MVKRVFAFIIRLAALGAILYAARSAMKRWIDGPEPSASSASWEPAGDLSRAAPKAEAPPAPKSAFTPAPPTPPGLTPAAEASSATADGPTPAPIPVPDAAGDPVETFPRWVTPDPTGEAPDSHPVKVKTASKVYREPGSAGYDRCRPDRCYATVQAAEADGFTRAKR